MGIVRPVDPEASGMVPEEVSALDDSREMKDGKVLSFIGK